MYFCGEFGRESKVKKFTGPKVSRGSKKQIKYQRSEEMVRSVSKDLLDTK